MSRPTKEALQLVTSLMSLPENSICADCQKKVAKWASSTLGIFICIDCSGIHRSLGTHISFVRSCTLDSWTPEQARLMRRVGNKVANEYWEANLPPDFMRPSPSDRYGMECFIRAKYVERRWAAPGEPPSSVNYKKTLSPARSTGNIYEGYFVHNPVQQQQPQHHYVMPQHHSKFAKTENTHSASQQTGLNLQDFMSQLNPTSDENTNQQETFSFTDAESVESNSDSQGTVEPTPTENSSFSFINEEKTVKEPVKVTPKPVVVNKAPSNKVYQSNPQSEPNLIPASTTASEIMKGQIKCVGNKKQRLFNKKPKGVARFMKKPSSESPDVEQRGAPETVTQPTVSSPQPQPLTSFQPSPSEPIQSPSTPYQTQTPYEPTQANYGQTQANYGQTQNYFDQAQNEQSSFGSAAPQSEQPPQKPSYHFFNVPNPFAHKEQANN
ncbi:ARF GAP-like zinc finger-containing protein [Histomonas meleagridis]|uniref:ARF GAP-like zinc finger-containing protein n=1 Tax=Histomonas meleagridis TaxID=135588 RepID=UPI003559452E|nr:ARF GAP-like zinc finger-containing protein [Histomonas meleagridis]KAH0801571.1 ARF GAP-like zinc finger-containing protein [Histomonas meleagridis]